MSQTNQLSSLEGWSGDVGVYELKGNRLHLKAEDAGTASVSKEINIKDSCYWRASWRAEFSPSASNQYRLYFMSDSNINSVVSDALYIEVGESGSQDAVKLFQVKNGETSLIKSLHAGAFSEVGISHGLVLRKVADDYSLFVDGHNSFDFKFETSGWLNGNINERAVLGISNKFTKSNKDAFYLDYFHFGRDVFDDVGVGKLIFNASQDELQVSFSQGLSGLSLVDVEVLGTELEFDYSFGGDSLIVMFNGDFQEEKKYKISLHFTGSMGEVFQLSSSFWFYEIDPFDLIFTEFMLDYESNTGFLQQGQYIELYNGSNHPIDLQRIQLLIDGDSLECPEFILSSGDFVTLMKDTGSGENYKNVLKLNDWTNLSTKKGKVAIVSHGNIIDSFNYDIVKFGVGFKQEGGWSIELNDIASYCVLQDLWSFSEDDIGGTPGRTNSVKKEMSGESLDEVSIRDVYFENEKKISVVFNMKLSPIKLSPSSFVSDLEIEKVEQSAGQLNRFDVFFVQKMDAGKWYSFSMVEVSSCLNLQSNTQPHHYGIPATVEAGDLIINEILSESNFAKGDYIELYNNSLKVIDLSQVLIGGFDEVGGLQDTYEVAVGKKMLIPGQYTCVTGNGSSVSITYLSNLSTDTANIHEVNTMPNLSATSGKIGVVNRSGLVIDVVSYDQSWHTDLLADTKGVALERKIYKGGSSDSTNWNSATFDVDFGTPGYQNSNYIDSDRLDGKAKDKLYLMTDHVDLRVGENNMLSVGFDLGVTGYALTGVLYSSNGVVKEVFCENISIGTSGEMFFDLNEFPYLKESPSVYIVFFEAIHPVENKIVLKQSVSIF